MTSQVAPITGQSVVTAHEDRLQALEKFASGVIEAFPHLADSLGVPRAPHQYSKDEMTGLQFDPSMAGVQNQMAGLRETMDEILSRLGPAGGSSGPIANPSELPPGFRSPGGF